MPAIDRLRSGIRQYQATTGRRMSPEILQALLQAELDAEKKQQASTRDFELRKEQSDENNRRYAEEVETQKKAARTSGAIQTAGTAITAAQILKGTSLGAKIGLGAKTAAPAVTTAATSTGANTGTAALATKYGSGTVGGQYTAGTGTTSGAASTGGSSIGSAANSPSGIGAAVIADAMFARNERKKPYEDMGERSGEIFEGLTEYGGFTVGQTALAKEHGVLSPQQYAKEHGGTLGREGARWNEDVSGGAQKIVEETTPDFVNEVLTDSGTVICTELNRQGFISDRVLKLDSLYCLENVSRSAYAGYLEIGTPIANAMKKSKVVTFLVKPFGMAFANEMAHRIDGEIKGNVLGTIILNIGVPICELISSREACYGSI